MIPESGHGPEYDIQPPRSDRWDVLHDDDSGLQLANDPGHLEKQAGLLTCQTRSLPGCGDVLTGEAADENVNGMDGLSGDGSDIGIPLSVRPMTGQDAAAVVALLDLPDCLSSHASRRQAALYSEIQPPDAAE
jgi:hypothetical protein